MSNQAVRKCGEIGSFYDDDDEVVKKNPISFHFEAFFFVRLTIYTDTTVKSGVT